MNKIQLIELPEDFHTIRGYLTTGRSRSTGREILVYASTCRHQGCTYSRQYTSRLRRATGDWLHRSDSVKMYRLSILEKLTEVSWEEMNLRMHYLADNVSDTYTTWIASVNTVFSHYVNGFDSDDIPDFDWVTHHRDGMAAGVAVRLSMKAAIDA